MKSVKILSEREPEGGFRGLTAAMLSFGLALAVFAISGMVPAGCDNFAGVCASAETTGVVPDSAAGTTGSGTAATKIIKVKFEVLNGGSGVCKHAGVISTQDDSYLVKNSNIVTRDFTITITVPASDEYLNVRWWGDDFWLPDTYVKAKTKAESGTITVDYNGINKVATKNLYDVKTTTDSSDWNSAYKRAVKN